ncbi:MAG: sugar phosphate nucleotidyltransferase [Candidatus Hodarchaeota archaeon]
MKALILAGGFGTRLRPLTCSRPKQLLPLATTTLIGHLLTQLRKSGITEVILATGYGGDRLKGLLGKKTATGQTLHYSIEPQPLGTAGAIKHAESLLQGEPAFLVVNGDIISDIDYTRLIQFHNQHEATATIGLYHVDNPSRFGVVDITSDGQILDFIEKPDPGLAPSNLINAGCYVLESQVLDDIPPNREVSIEREVFPSLCQSGKVYGWEHTGFWIDTGTPSAFIKAHQVVFSDAPRVGAKTQIASSAVIGPDVSIGDRVQIGPMARIHNSVIFDDACIAAGAIIDSSIIGQGAMIGANLHLDKFVLVGDRARLDAGAHIPEGALICPDCHVKKGETPPTCLLKGYQSLTV